MKKIFILIFLILIAGCSSRPTYMKPDVKLGQNVLYLNKMEWFLMEIDNSMIGVTPLNYVDDDIISIGVGVVNGPDKTNNLSINNIHFFVNGKKAKVLKKSEIIDSIEFEHTLTQIRLGVAGFLSVFGASVSNSQQSYSGYSNGNYYTGSISTPGASQIAANNASRLHAMNVSIASLTKEQKIEILNNFYLETVTVFPNEYQEGIVYLEKNGDYKQGDILDIVIVFGGKMYLYKYKMEKVKS